MAKRRHGHHDEVLLIPFLDILCSLIGVLILIIVVLCVAQTQKANGRTKEELARSEKFQRLQREEKTLRKTEADLKKKIADMEKAKVELLAKKKKIEELKPRLDNSGEAAKKNQEMAAKLQAQIAAAIAQTAVVQKGIPPVEAEIAKLKAELEARKKTPESVPRIVVRSSGSGTQNKTPFFIESNAQGIVIHKGPTEKVTVPGSMIAASPELAAFLESVKAVPNSTVIFLLRRDGFGTYRAAASLAESRFGIITGKLPLPGDGAVDLNLFNSR